MMAVKPLQSDRDVVSTQVNPESRKVEELRQLIVLWRLYVLLSQRVVNKRHEAILLFLSPDRLHTNYQDECVLAEMLDEIKDRYRSALETGIFSRKDGKIRKNCRLAKQYEALTPVWKEHFEFKFSLPEFVAALPYSMEVAHELFSENHLLEITGVDNKQVRILNLSFLPSTFFETHDDDLLSLAANFCCGGSVRADPSTSIPNQSFLNRPAESDFVDNFVAHTSNTQSQKRKRTTRHQFKGNFKSHCHEMTGGHMRIFAFREKTDRLRLVKEWKTDMNIAFFWQALRLSIPCCKEYKTNGPIGGTASMLFTTTETPQEPHTDYFPHELDNGVQPWGMDFALRIGGFCLNIWSGYVCDDCLLDARGRLIRSTIPPENYAIKVQIPFKYIFLMRGDTVHGGALENGARIVNHRGALRLHWYLSPGVKNGPGITRSTAFTKRSDSRIYTKSSTSQTARALVTYLVQTNGSMWE